MLVEGSQCAAYVTEFGSQFVNIALLVVQGVISFMSIVGSVLLILSYVLFKKLRSKSRLLITHLAAANFLAISPSFLAVFMDFRTRFKVAYSNHDIQQPNNTELFNLTKGLSCSGNAEFFDSSANIYCNLCVYLGFISVVGSLSTIFWTISLCIHFFILVSYPTSKLASRLTYAYYVIAWLFPLGISLWLLFHNWLGFEPTYSTVNCGIRAKCVPHHHPYHYQNSYGKSNWNKNIGVIFGLLIWQVLIFLLIPCLFVAIQCKNRRRHQVDYWPFSSSPIRNIERKILLIPMIFMLMSTANFVSDLYYFINQNNNLKYLQSNDGVITFIHFVVRICDNSPGVINFCLFCLFSKQFRKAVIDAIKQRVSTRRTTAMPEISFYTPEPIPSD